MKAPLSAGCFAVFLMSLPALCQTAPTATTTFTGATDTDWTVAGNWDSGLPDASDDAWIDDNQTAAVTSAYLDTNPFGTLTLGTNSALQLASANNAGLPAGSNVYFNDGSHLQYTSGTSNRDDNFYMLPGASAKVTTANNTFMRGEIVGSGNLEYVIGGSTLELRRDVTDADNNLVYTGDMTFTLAEGRTTAKLWLRQYGKWAKNRRKLGSGVNTIGDGIYVTPDNSNYIDNASTLVLVGGTGGTNSKIEWGADRGDTVANLIIDSPTGSAPTVSLRNSRLVVTDTVTFQGNAGTVRLESRLAGYKGDVQTSNVVFSGTGDWTVEGIGDGVGRLELLSGSTVTTNTNATINNGFKGSAGFTKAGSGKLTVTGDLSTFSGTVNVTAGELAMAGSSNITIAMAAGTQLGIGAANSAADTLNLGSGALALGEGSTINWQFNGATTAGSDYDTIISSATLDLTSLTNLIIDGTSLGYEAQIGDAFTLFNGTVNGFDAGKFTLNLPTLTEGTWEIQEGSLQLVVVPEPSVALLGGLGMLGLLMRRRRNR